MRWALSIRVPVLSPTQETQIPLHLSGVKSRLSKSQVLVPPDPDESICEVVEHFFLANHPDHYITHQTLLALLWASQTLLRSKVQIKIYLQPGSRRILILHDAAHVTYLPILFNI